MLLCGYGVCDYLGVFGICLLFSFSSSFSDDFMMLQCCILYDMGFYIWYLSLRSW